MARMGTDADVDLARIRPGGPAASAHHDADFERRLASAFPVLHGLFHRLYGERDDALDVLAGVIADAAASWAERPTDLKVADARREQDSTWYLSNGMLGGVCYVDRYAGDLTGIRARIPEFVELGLTYLHLMPLFAVPEGNSDGGYAVSSYRAVAPHLGTIDDLQGLAAELRANGISLVLDFIFNHTASNHEWARRAVAGEPGYEDFYLIFPDRAMPDAYEKTVREIFPDDHPGSFVPLPDGRWIWATFHTFQWDLNYANPAVFRAMAGEMLFLANLGVDVLRMDAVAFIWKRLGTPCESLPEAHLLLQAFNAVLRIAAPSLLFKSEAIVHPDEVVEYISPGECQLSYNPLQMALTWEALATRDPRMLRQALERRHALPDGCAWVNYVRGHDDIGWTFADEDAAELGIDGFDHRRFLNAFYVNRFPGSFARGVPFQENPRTGDARVAGTTASLAGVEAGDPHGVDRVLLAHAIALSTGGIPLVYLGDEVAQLNDYGFVDDPALADDSRWVNRPRRPDEAYAARHDRDTAAGAVYAGLTRLIQVRRGTPEFAGGRLVPFDPRHPTVLAYQRPAATDGAAAPGTTAIVLCLANVGDAPAAIDALTLSGFAPEAHELITDRRVSLERGIVLEPCHVAWLRVRAADEPPRF
ncbi:amylosucrase [Agromyces luteolus]|uniref:Amylosucrase n=1 Tax=Agromyces luteolus TaxID=88373 RepID=A0A7C9MEY4_9MICO|nr:alpha-amylase family protein [Agromyces luteolus]MUN05558.1 amylosucrase [Agromyces luteolus]GLK26098.1 amylosucrase [Agromyces luteolus]